MMRGPIIHGVLLVAVLIYGYQTWTRDEKPEPKTGEVEVWSKNADEVTSVLYETKDRTVRIDRKKAEDGAYFWGEETRVTKVRPPRKPGQQPPAAEPESKTTVRDFPIGTRGEEAVENLANLRALRDLGELGEDEKEKFELLESTDSITVVFGEGDQRTLILGGRVYGGADRYVLDTKTGKGYAIAGSLISPLHGGETGLNLRKIHAYEKDDVHKVDLVAHMLGDKELSLVRTETETEHGTKKGWADARTPDKPDQTVANLLNRINGVRPTQYMEKSEIEEPEKLTKLATLTYREQAGGKLGYFELYKHEVMEDPEPEPPKDPETPEEPEPEEEKPEGAAKGTEKKAEGEPEKKAEGEPEENKEEAEPPAPTPKVTYYVKTERTKIYGRIGKSLGNLIERDLTQQLSDE